MREKKFILGGGGVESARTSRFSLTAIRSLNCWIVLSNGTVSNTRAPLWFTTIRLRRSDWLDISATEDGNRYICTMRICPDMYSHVLRCPCHHISSCRVRNPHVQIRISSGGNRHCCYVFAKTRANSPLDFMRRSEVRQYGELRYVCFDASWKLVLSHARALRPGVRVKREALVAVDSGSARGTRPFLGSFFSFRSLSFIETTLSPRALHHRP
jgi:hypothetical protein